MQVTRFPGSIDPLKAKALQAKTPRFQGSLKTEAPRDMFIRRTATAPVRFGADAKYVHPEDKDLVNQVYRLGGPKSATRNHIGFRVSRHFANNKTIQHLQAFLSAKDDETAIELMDGFVGDRRYYKAYVWNGPRVNSEKMLPKVREIAKQHLAELTAPLDATYGDLFDNMSRMAAGYKQMGIGEGSRVAIAETNSLDYLSTYYGALAVGATAVPINLLALTNDSEKMENLMHMVAGAKSDAYIFGADRAFKPMAGFKKILTLKNIGMVRRVVERYVANEAPRHFLEKLLYKQLDKGVQESVNTMVKAYTAAQVAKGRKIDEVVVGEDKLAEFRKQARADFKTLFEKLPADIKLITPEAKTKLMRQKPMHPSNLLLHPDPKTFADIIFTSGTSGMPKGVGLSHQNQVFTVDSLSKATEKLLQPDDVMLLGLPLFHIFGKAVMLTALNRQIPMVMIPSLKDAMADLHGMVDTIHDYKITALPAVPLVLEKLMAHVKKHPEDADKLKTLRLIVSGGAALKKDTYDALKAINPNLQVVEGYGSTEAGIVTLNQSGEPGLIGHALPGVDAKLVESDEAHGFYGFTTWTGPGEILVKSPGVAQYVEGTVPKEQPLQLTDERGYFHTGDIARRVPEKAHAMQIQDRISNFHKDRGGERRPITQYEASVKGADSRVTDAMGVSFKPNRETEKMVVIAVSPDPSVTEESLRAALSAQVNAGNLAGMLVPEHIIVLERETLPPAFQNDFKREAGYKVAKKFLEAALQANLVKLEDRGNGNDWWKTVIPDKAALEQFAENYRYGGKKP